APDPRRRCRAARRRPRVGGAGLACRGRDARREPAGQRQRPHAADPGGAAARVPEGGAVTAAGVAPSRRALREQSTGLLGWFTTERVLAVAVPVALVLMALAPLHEVYLTPVMWLTVAGGALLGTAIATLGARRRGPALAGSEERRVGET